MKPHLVWRALAYLALVAACAVTLFPVYAVVLMALSKAPGFAVVIAPQWSALTLDHLRDFVSTRSPNGDWLFGRQLVNSLLASTGATLLGVGFATTAAYAFSRFRFPGQRAGLAAFVVVQMFPGTLMIVPLFLILSHLELVDSVLGLVLVYTTTALPLCVWMLKGYFDSLPYELDEAARMDGAGHLRIFYQLLLPLARPAIAVTALFSFLTAWNEFILAATFLSREEAFTLPVVLYRHVGSYGTNWGAFAAGSLLVSIPVCALFLFLQRHLVEGLSAGAVK